MYNNVVLKLLELNIDGGLVTSSLEEAWGLYLFYYYYINILNKFISLLVFMERVF